MAKEPSRMRHEIEEIPEAVERLLSEGAGAIRGAADEVAGLDPRFVVTVARGSSDHVCSYLKYACELLLGLPVASVGPSVASIYGAPLKVAGSLCLAVSQSGQSPDIVALARQARAQGACGIALTNNPSAPLAKAASLTLDIHAGPELSIAATKTFVNSAVAGLWLLAAVKGDEELVGAIRALPEQLDRATRADWSAVSAAIGGGRSLYTLGRGPAWAISNEAALKYKEICSIHAESFSSAEVLHGPVSIVGHGFPILAFAAADAAEAAVVEVADRLSETGAEVFITSSRARQATALGPVRTGHWLTDPIALIVSFYSMIERVARDLGVDPDKPPRLNKITETI